MPLELSQVGQDTNFSPKLVKGECKEDRKPILLRSLDTVTMM